MPTPTATSSGPPGPSMPSGADICCFEATIGPAMLQYETTGRARPSAIRAILKEIDGIERDWWRGALGFDVSDDAGPSILSGKTALFHKSGIPDDEDLFMAFA